MADIKITKLEYDKMQRDLSKLNALEAGGVDNWEGFDDSLTDWRKENDLTEMIDGLVHEFSESVGELSCDATVDFPAGMDAGCSVMMPDSEDAARAFIAMVINKYKEIEAG
jgi:hypothetical protein